MHKLLVEKLRKLFLLVVDLPRQQFRLTFQLGQLRLNGAASVTEFAQLAIGDGDGGFKRAQLRSGINL